MVHIFISEKDGDVHFSIKNNDRQEFEECVGLFKMNYLKYNSDSKNWTYPIRIKVLEIIDELERNGIEIDVSQDDMDVLRLSLYPPSDELKKIKIPLDKDLLEKFPPLKGEHPNENYQLESIKKFTTCNKVILNLFPRLGKTYISSIGLASLMKRGDIDCVFGIMRPEGLQNFAMELIKFTDRYITENDIIILDKTTRDIENHFDKKIILCSYNTWRLTNEYYKKQNKIKSKRPKKSFIKFDKWFNHRFLLLDECQSVTSDSLQYHYTQIHAHYFERICAMSGSLGYHLEKLYNIVNILTPKRLENMRKKEWWEYITRPTYSKFKREIIPSKLKEFENECLKPLMISFGENCLKVADNYEHVIYVNMGEKMQNVYRSACNDFLTQIITDGNGKITYSNFKKKFPTLRQITDDPSLIGIEHWDMENDNDKIEILKSILEDRIENNGKKVILWCNSPRSMTDLGKIFTKYNPIVVNGNEKLCGIKREERGDIIERIKTDENCNLLIANQVLSTSVSFWQYSVNIYWATPIDTDYYAQSIRRINGNGQKEKQIETIHLLYAKSIDNYLYENLTNQLKIKKYFDSIGDNDEMPMELLKNILNPKHLFTLEGELHTTL